MCLEKGHHHANGRLSPRAAGPPSPPPSPRRCISCWPAARAERESLNLGGGVSDPPRPHSSYVKVCVFFCVSVPKGFLTRRCSWWCVIPPPTLSHSPASSCAYGGTFWFVLPGDYLDVNPAGSVEITLSLGYKTLKTTIVFVGVLWFCCLAVLVHVLKVHHKRTVLLSSQPSICCYLVKMSDNGYKCNNNTI